VQNLGPGYDGGGTAVFVDVWYGGPAASMFQMTNCQRLPGPGVLRCATDQGVGMNLPYMVYVSSMVFRLFVEHQTRIYCSILLV
jgi:hypothetical protein